MAVASARAAVPRVIGRFSVLRVLGRGAQGRVYLCEDPELHRQVALKTIAAPLAAGAEGAARLVSEAKLVARLSHPNIVPVYEVGEHEAMPFVVFEYVEGPTLKRRLHDGGPLDAASAIIMMSQILAGVAHAHAASLVHGDLKPSNVLLSGSGAPRVADFGIAHSLWDTAAQPASGGTGGTLCYMAPELFSGGGMDPRTDVYALGAMMYEMLAGEPPHGAGGTHATIYRTLNEAVVPVSHRAASVDPALDAFLARALARRPEDRYADAAAMKAELDRFRVAPKAAADVMVASATVHSTVEFLLRRIQLKSDFPMFSGRFAEINRLAGEGSDASLEKLSNFILQDLALTARLLRLVNSAAYSSGGKPVTKVSEAITRLGLEQLRSIAMGLMLAHASPGRAITPEIGDVLTASFVTGVVARNVGRLRRLANVEELFIGGMLSVFGEILAAYYLPEEYAEVRRRVSDAGETPRAAARCVLGIEIEALGIEVARRWNFPDTILAGLREAPPGVLPADPTPAGAFSRCAWFARELCGIARSHPAALLDEAMEELQARHALAVGIERPLLTELALRSAGVARQYLQVMGIDTAQNRLIESLERWSNAPAPAPEVAKQPAAAAPASSPESAASAPAAPPAPAKPATGLVGKLSGWLRGGGR